MGTLPAGLVAGNYYPIYDAYYQQVDPSNQGSVGAMESAKFLKTSGLSDVMLSKIWDLADSNGKGFLTKNDFFVALKLVALVQAGQEPMTANLSLDVPPPKMGNSERISLDSTPVNAPTSSVDDWTMKPAEKKKYEELFDSMNPSNGVIPGNIVKGLLMDSKLPILTLGKIWELADIDQDGALDRCEFSIAMHLVYKALEKYAIPSCLPPELIPQSKRKDSLLLTGTVQVLPAVPNGVRSETPVFKSITPPLPQPIMSPPTMQPLSTSGPIRQPSLPQISSPPLIPPLPSALPPPIVQSATPTPLIPLVDSEPSSVPMTVTPPLTGLATTAMFPADTLLSPVEETWVISNEEKLKYDTLFEQADLDRDGFVSGHEIKNTFLKSGVAQPVLAHIWALCDTAEQGKLNNEQFALALWLISRKLKGIDPPPKLTPEMVPPSCRKPSETSEPLVFSSPEVDRLTKEIDDLIKEKLTLETNVTQREADIKIKAGEIKSLQGELDTLVATLKQLENQKGEAMKRINDLKTQNEELESEVKDINSKVEVELEEVNKLRHQTEEQERNLKAQETELNKKKLELEGLKHEEATLTEERDKLKQEIAGVAKQSTEAAEVIEEIRTRLIDLDDFQAQLKEAISHLDTVLQSKSVNSLSEVHLNIEPKFQNESYTSLMNRILKVTNPPSAASDPFADMNSGRSGSADFTKTDAFKNDPFDSKDPFTSSGFEVKDTTDGFATDGFANFGSQNIKKADPFANNLGTQSNVQSKEDPFAGDPFAILHAPPRPSAITGNSTAPRSESPSPALPPKKCKQPPPRPAPPRPAPPSLPSGFDSDFADFSGFSHKMAVSSSSSSSSSISSSAYSTVRRELSNAPEKKDDPFRDYRYDDPFEMADELDAAPKPSAPSLLDSNSNAFDPFVGGDPFASVTKPASVSNGVSSSKTATTLPKTNGPQPSEDQQLAWATAESVKSEKERRKRAEQEKADMKKALKLSKADSKKRSYKPKVFS